jgi:thiosulfate dehydrogenase [quinone] large subunit
MNDAKDKTTHENHDECGCGCGWSDGALAFMVLRLWLAVRALVTGLEKFTGTMTVKKPLLDEFGNPDATGAMVEVKAKVYGVKYYHAVADSLKEAFNNEPIFQMMPFLLNIYYAVLGPVLIILGLTLLLGICTRISLFAMGLLYTSLTFGLILIGQDGGVAWLAAHMILIAVALMLAKHNRLTLMNKW